MIKNSILALVVIIMASCNTTSKKNNTNGEVRHEEQQQPVATPEINETMDIPKVDMDRDEPFVEAVEVIQLETSLGIILIWLYDETPRHKANFMKLTREGFYDGTTFHRVIPNFMIQGGDPNSKDDNPANDGAGGPGYTLEAEILPRFRHKPGAVAAARQGDQVNPQKRSSGSQFYIVQNPGGTPQLDGQYTVFGETITGMDVVNRIAQQPRDGRDRPLEKIEMTVSIIDITPDRLSSEFNFIPPHLR